LYTKITRGSGVNYFGVVETLNLIFIYMDWVFLLMIYYFWLINIISSFSLNFIKSRTKKATKFFSSAILPDGFEISEKAILNPPPRPKKPIPIKGTYLL
jgi:hypothetical protein